MNHTNDEHTAHVRSLLGQKLPSEHNKLVDLLKELEMRYISMVEARVDAQTNLSNKRLQYLHPKDPQYTDMDRKIMLDAHISGEQARYDSALGLEDTLRQRISIIRELLVQ